MQFSLRTATMERRPAKREKERVRMATNCEECVHFDYDEEADVNFCNMDLDEDEMAHFMMGNFSHCPYFQLYDEYKIVRKQM